MRAMADFGKAWPLLTAVGSAIAGIAVLVQTGFSIAKSRYELRKLRVEDVKYRAKIAREKARIEGIESSYGRSDYYYRRLDYDLGTLVRWIVMTVFLAVSGLFYVYVTLEIHKNDTAIRVKRAELVVLKQANASLGDALLLLHAWREGRQKLAEGDKQR
jgi:hypothetical protein